MEINPHKEGFINWEADFREKYKEIQCMGWDNKSLLNAIVSDIYDIRQNAREAILEQ